MKYSIEEITAKLDAIEQTMTEYQIPPQTYVIARDLLTEIDRLEALLQRSLGTKRALADECERLTARAEQLALNIKSEWETNEELRSRLDRAQALVSLERKRVAGECAEIAERGDVGPHCNLPSTRAICITLAQEIREKYGVEE